MANETFKIVNNTCQNINAFDAILSLAVDNGFLPEELNDVFTLTILAGYNADGSDRGILDWA